MPVMEETYWTPKELAERFKVREQTVRNWIHRGWLEGTRLGDTWRVSETALKQFINNQDFLDTKSKKKLT